MNAITVVYPPSLRIEDHRACLHQIKRRPERNTLETNNRHRVESLSRVYTKPLRDVTRPYKFVIQDHDAPLHAKHSYERENSQEIRLEIWS